jgi:hypothetical protein
VIDGEGVRLLFAHPFALPEPEGGRRTEVERLTCRKEPGLPKEWRFKSKEQAGAFVLPAALRVALGQPERPTSMTCISFAHPTRTP